MLSKAMKTLFAVACICMLCAEAQFIPGYSGITTLPATVSQYPGITTLPAAINNIGFPGLPTSLYPSVSSPITTLPATIGGISTTETCHTYKAYVQTTTATAGQFGGVSNLFAFEANDGKQKDAASRRRLQDGLEGNTHLKNKVQTLPSTIASASPAYEVLILEAVPLSQTVYQCVLYSETTMVSRYTFKLNLSPKHNTGSVLLYAPQFTEITSIGLNGFELTGEQALSLSNDIIVQHLRLLMGAHQVMFSTEGHFVFYTASTTIVFMKACSYATSPISGIMPYTATTRPSFISGVPTPSYFPDATRPNFISGVGTPSFLPQPSTGIFGLSEAPKADVFQRRRLQAAAQTENAHAVVYVVDKTSYKVNGIAAPLTDDVNASYEPDLEMKCDIPAVENLSCSLKVMNSIRFTATVNQDKSLKPGPVITTRMLPLGPAAAVERNINALLNEMNTMEMTPEGVLTLKSASRQLTFVPNGIVTETVPGSQAIAEANAAATRRLAEDDDKDWMHFEAALDDYVENGISGMSLFVGDKSIVSSLGSFPFGLRVQQVTTNVYTIVLRVVNQYRLTVTQNANYKWQCSTPVPLTSYVGPAPSMLMETRLLNTITNLNSLTVAKDRCVIGGMEASVTFKAVDADAVYDKTFALNTAASVIDGQEADMLEGATVIGKVSVRLTKAAKNLYKCIVKGTNTYSFDIQMIEEKPICSPVVMTQVVQPQVAVVERRVLEVFQTATSFIPTQSGCQVYSPIGNLVFV